MSLQVKEMVALAEKQLEDKGISDAKRDSRTLYCFLFGIPESRMILEYQNTVQDRNCEKYFDLIDRRASGEPLQYIVGSTEFMGLKFDVNPSVLIPRQDTETLVEDAISVIKKGELRGVKTGLRGAIRDALDLCCGSGAIGVSLSKQFSHLSVTCSDISEDALALAKQNSQHNGTGSNVRFVKGNMFEPFKGRFINRKFDLIISNPPYISSGVIPTLMPEVREHEPIAALDGGADGLDFYRIIAKEAGEHLKKQGVLMLEIGHDQRDAVMNLLDESGEFDDIRCCTDLTGKDRIIFAARINGKTNAKR